jgi:hypothetical protein
MNDLMVGAATPMRSAPPTQRDARRWPSTVHAIAQDQMGPPYKAECGAELDFLNLGWAWPPEITEHLCPACVRLTRHW